MKEMSDGQRGAWLFACRMVLGIGYSNIARTTLCTRAQLADWEDGAPGIPDELLNSLLCEIKIRLIHAKPESVQGIKMRCLLEEME